MGRQRDHYITTTEPEDINELLLHYRNEGIHHESDGKFLYLIEDFPDQGVEVLNGRDVLSGSMKWPNVDKDLRNVAYETNVPIIMVTKGYEFRDIQLNEYRPDGRIFCFETNITFSRR
jgi:hypothetical protein